MSASQTSSSSSRRHGQTIATLLKDCCERGAAAVRERISLALTIVRDETSNGHGLHGMVRDADRAVDNAACDAEAGLPWPHAGQARGSGAPHSEQNFAASGTPALQLGQFIYASKTDPYTGCNTDASISSDPFDVYGLHLMFYARVRR